MERERATLETALDEVGHEFHEAVWVITLVIEQFETELRWIAKVEREPLPRRPCDTHALTVIDVT